MQAPLSEPGYEMATGNVARVHWGAKIAGLHEYWNENRWSPVGESGYYYPEYTYRRPVESNQPIEHFI